MFIRKKRNKTGSTSVQIAYKDNGKYRHFKTIGHADSPEQINALVEEARRYIKRISGEQQLPFEENEEQSFLAEFDKSIQSLHLIGPELVLGRIFDEIGFNAIPGELFRSLVIARLVYPVSKLKTIDYLARYRGKYITKDKIYRYLDKLHDEHIQQIQEIGYRYASKLSETNMSVVFYDVTTLYFEAEDEDDLRRMGFSKEGRHRNPQILLCLLVNAEGFSLGYEIFEGNKFEGHTMLPVLEAFKTKYQLTDLVVVADSGLMSSKNLEMLQEKGYKYILGARIKNEGREVQKQILGLRFTDGQAQVVFKNEQNRLIVSYSEKRAGKDRANRERGLKRLEKAVATGKLTKQQLSNRGYNKYLTLLGETKIKINYEKIKADEVWDGLKGYFTNTDLSTQDIILQYGQLWKIEKAFRISKTDLRIRPVYHHLERRIRAHICIAFAASVVYKALERELKLRNAPFSIETTIEVLRTLYQITITTPFSNNLYSRIIAKKPEQLELLSFFNLNFGWLNA